MHVTRFPVNPFRPGENEIPSPSETRHLMMNRLSSLFVGFAVLCGFSSLALCAQPYPARPVRLVAPFPPGSSVDFTSRLFAPGLSEALGQQFVIDNRPGAAGNIGAELVARSASAGYTLLTAPSSLAAIA